jgi:hypothetical protein
MKPDSVQDATYRLVIRGELDERYHDLFEGMQIDRSEGKTILVGSIRDQAHLLGLIERAQELGLELLSVEPAAEAESQPECGQERNEA